MSTENSGAAMSTESIADLRARLTAIEQWKIARDIEAARHDERWKHFDLRFNTVETKINDINGGLKKIAWLMASAIILALMAWIVRGGLAP